MQVDVERGVGVQVLDGERCLWSLRQRRWRWRCSQPTSVAAGQHRYGPREPRQGRSLELHQRCCGEVRPHRQRSSLCLECQRTLRHFGRPQKRRSRRPKPRLLGVGEARWRRLWKGCGPPRGRQEDHREVGQRQYRELPIWPKRIRLARRWNVLCSRPVLLCSRPVQTDPRRHQRQRAYANVRGAHAGSQRS